MNIKTYTNCYYSNNKLHLRGLDENGNRTIVRDIDYEPTVWVPLDYGYHAWKDIIVDQQHTTWHTMVDNNPMTSLTFDSITSARKFVQQNNKYVDNGTGKKVNESRVHTAPSNMFISQFLAENFKHDQHIKTEQLKVYTYDIETEVGHRDVDNDTLVKCRTVLDDNQIGEQSVEVKTMTIAQYERMPNRERWELFNEQTQTWCSYEDHPYRYLGGFPEPMQADERITLITVKDVNHSQIYTWGLFEFENKRSDVKYFKFDTEYQLLKHFVEWWSEDYPDIMTGWNCLEKTSSVWMNDRIVDIQDINVGDQLVDSKVLRKSDISLKTGYKLNLYSNLDIQCSEDHIFPCYVVDKNRYTNFTPRYNDTIDLDVKNMIHNQNEGREVFVKMPIHENQNHDLTMRDMILNNIEWFVGRVKFFNVSKEELCDVEELRAYISTESEVLVYYNQTISDVIRLDTVIDEEWCHLLGLIYTDGSIDNKSNQIVFYSSDLELFNRTNNTFRRYFVRKPRYNGNSSVNPIKGNYYTKIAQSNVFGLLLSLITDKEYKKKLNKTMLSLLSKKQFFAFFSGLVDGDGYVTKSKNSNGSYTYGIGYCNYNNDVTVVKELLWWNGVLSGAVSKDDDQYNELLIYKSFINKAAALMDLWYVKKHDLICTIRNLSGYSIPKTSKAKAKDVYIRQYDDFVVVKVKNIECLNQPLEMVDIETDTHYFRTQGVKTHNCSSFDQTYVANRVKKVLGVDYMNRLSPYGVIDFKEVEHNEFGNSIVETTWCGISNLDYLKLYKKFTYGNRESYKLDAIAEDEIGIKKVPNPTGGSFKDFYTGDFEVLEPPSVDDHEVRKLGYQRSKLHAELLNNPTDNNIREQYNKLDEHIKKMCHQIFTEYNIRDVELVDKIDAKHHFIDLIMMLGHMARCNFEDIFSPTRTWDHLIFNYCNNNNLVIPIKKMGTKTAKFAGAYVKSPLVGKHEFCESFDLDSL